MNFMKTLLIGAASLLLVSSAVIGDEPLPTGQVKITGVEVKAIDRIQIGEKILDKDFQMATGSLKLDFDLVEKKFQEFLKKY